MYLNNISAVDYSDPWNIPLERRLKTLERGHRRVAYIYLWPDYFVFRYRVYNMVQALQDSVNGTSAAYFTHKDLAFIDRVVDMADVIVICRTKYDRDVNHIITRARAKGKTIIFDVDDLVFDVKYIHLILNTHDLNRSDPITWDNWFAHIGRISATLQLCDRAIATNEYLATFLQPHFNEKVSVIPNFFNREQMEISERIYKLKKSSDFSHSNRIHLGYFSGTPSHNKDFNVAADALAKILEKNPQVALLVVGPMSISGPLKNYSAQIERYPLTDYLNLQRLIGQVEANLVPLQDNEFTNCKSELKYFEAGIVGTVTLATPTYSYAHAIQDGKNGFLAKSFEWYEKTQDLLDMVSNSAVEEIAENAMLLSTQHYAWYNQTIKVEGVLFPESSASSTPDNHEERSLPILAEKEQTIEIEGGIDQKEWERLGHMKYEKLLGEMKEHDLLLRSREAELAEIRGSRAWKAVNVYWKLLDWLIPARSLQGRLVRFLKGMILHPGSTIKLTTMVIKQSILNPKRKVLRIQNELIKQNFPKDTASLIVFLVPGVNGVNGGTMSICSLAKVSQSLKLIHNSEVLIATLPGGPFFSKFTLFDNPFDIYRFEQLRSYFKDLEELTIHIPEAFVSHFLAYLTSAEREYLKSTPKLHINILNQNIWLMPPREIVAQVKQFTDLVTCTTAHSRYCTQELRNHFGIPFHNFSTSNLTDYQYLPYKEKENIIVISHDQHRYKEKILAKIQNEHPGMTIKVVQNLRYEEYKRLLTRAKWAITFGEGLDGYFVESIRSGAIPFAVFNRDFFPDRFKGLPNIYLSYEQMYDNISDDLVELGAAKLFESLSNRLIELDKQEYNDEKYRDNVRRFYTGEYDLP